MEGAYPTGAIARIQRTDFDLVEKAQPDYVMMKINRARSVLMDEGLTFDDVLPEGTKAITTTTIPDEKLNLLAWGKPHDNWPEKFSEIDILKAVQPDYHIPADCSTYVEQTREQQREAVKWCVGGTKWMHEQTEDMDVTLLPLVKGLTKKQRKLCYEEYRKMGYNCGVFYGTQHCTSIGLQEADLIADLERIWFESDMNVICISGLDPYLAKKMPRNVVGVAGNHYWRNTIEEHDGAAEMQAAQRDLDRQTREALAADPYADHDEESFDSGVEADITLSAD